MFRRKTFLLTREQVAPLVAEGMLDKEIAYKLGCCRRTVLMARKRFHLACPYKMGASKYIDRWRVIELVKLGLTDQLVAKEMRIHYNTVANIRNESYPKLNPRNRNKLIEEE